MLGGIIAILIGVWFYQTAQADQKQPVSWAIAGILVYFIGALFWSYAITPMIKEAARHSQNSFLTLLAQFAYVGIGAVCALGLKLALAKKGSL